MRVEDYFDFVAPDDIRIKGHRIGIESILYEYVHRGHGPEQIARRFPTLGLGQIYATIFYYLEHQPEMSQYLAQWLEGGRAARAAQEGNRPPVVEKLRRVKATRARSRDRSAASALDRQRDRNQVSA